MDSALARESFDGAGAEDLYYMAHPDWTVTAGNVSTPSYDRRLWATDWHKLFDSADHRSKLTWLNRFVAASPKIHNFYSSTEDVLARIHGGGPWNTIVSGWESGTAGRYAWTIQEKTKGRRIDDLVGVFHFGSRYGGWDFNLTDPVDEDDPIWYYVYAGGGMSPDSRFKQSSTTIGSPSSATLDGAKRSPLFYPGWGTWETNAASLRVVNTSFVVGPSWIVGLYGATSGNVTAGNPVFRAQLLAEAFPALSLPVGGNETPKFDDFGTRNYNMPVAFVIGNGWPTSLGIEAGTNIPNWHHGSIREVAYLHLFRAYDKIVEISKISP